MDLKLFLLKKYLFDWKDNTSRTKIIVTVLSSVISTMAILLVIGSLNGFQYVISNKVHDFYPELGISNYNVPEYLSADPDSFQAMLESMEQVKYVEPALYSEFIMASFNPDNSPRSLSGTMIRGINAKNVEQAFQMLQKRGFKARTLERKKEGVPVVLGSELARRLMVVPGDRFFLYVPFFRSTIAGPAHKSQEVYLAGVIDTGLFRYNAIAGFMLMKDMRYILEIEEDLYSLDIYLETGTDVENTKSELKNIIHSGIRDYTHISQSITGFYDLIKHGLYFVLSIILIVGFFNIISMIILMVLEKLKEFSILNVMGLPLSSIAVIVGIRGFITGFFSSALGLGLTILISFLQNSYQIIKIEESIYDIAYLPIYLDMAEMTAIMVIITLMNTLIPLLPSIRVLRLNPSEILRYE